MTRTTPPLQQHLLTRSDFARMGVPAAQILSWLATSSIEQVGTLGAADHGDPVFTVVGTLRAELTAKLAEIGKTAVVLSPLRVRSFLLRAMLPNAAPVPSDAADGETPMAAAEPMVAVAEPMAEADLADVLQEAARWIAADVDAVLQIAAEEAGLDAGEATTETAPPSDADPSADACEPVANDEPTTDDATAESDHCFDFDDLASELDDLLGGEPIAAPTETSEFSETAGAAEEPPLPIVADPTDTAVEVAPPAAPAVGAESLDADLFAQSLPAEQPAASLAQDAALAAFEPESEPPPQPESEPQSEPQSTLSEPAETDMTPTAPVAPATTMATLEDGTRSSPSAAAVADHEPDQAAIVETAPDDAEAATTAEQVTEPESQITTETESPSTAVPVPNANVSMPAASDLVALGAEASKDRFVEESFATTSATMQRVESFLDQLKSALVEMAQRPAPIAAIPAPPPVDVAPLVEALHAGFDRSAEQSAATSAALSALSAKIGSMGEHFEQGVQQVVTNLRREPTEQRHATELVITRSDRTPVAMFAVAALVTAWAGLFWLKTGSTRLAVSTLIGANVVGCCLLAAWRRRV